MVKVPTLGTDIPKLSWLAFLKTTSSAMQHTGAAKLHVF